MTSEPFPCTLTEEKAPQIGLIVLQSDESIESDFRRLIPLEVDVLVSRVPSGTEVTAETLSAMEAHLTVAASLFPISASFAVVGYGCTSGTAQIGAAEVARRIHAGTATHAVTEPVTALIAACQTLCLARLALLSPYVAPVSERLRETIVAAGIEIPAFGSFDVAEEARVARIDSPSILRAAEEVAIREKVDGIFLSCTNLRTLDIIPLLQERFGFPVLSSNLVLAWHLMHLAGAAAAEGTPRQLLATAIKRPSV